MIISMGFILDPLMRINRESLKRIKENIGKEENMPPTAEK